MSLPPGTTCVELALTLIVVLTRDNRPYSVRCLPVEDDEGLTLDEKALSFRPEHHHRGVSRIH